MTNYKRVNNITGWIVFAIAAFTYLSTIEPTASFWDCGEYIATAYKLEVGHPPGAPLFNLMGRFFTLFTDKAHAAKAVNSLSALFSAFTILFLFWSITALVKKIALKRGDLTNASLIAIMGSGAVGALAYTFSDSFWFSAVEGEVYAGSSFFTAIVVWAIFRWEEVSDQPYNEKWLILIAYLFGLSVGVHLLNLLAIPAIVFVYYFKRYTPTRNGIIITSIIAILLLGLIQSAVIPGIVSLAGNFELFFTNTLGLGFNTGTIIYFLLLVGALTYGIIYTQSNKKSHWNLLIGAAGFIMLVALITASSAGALVVRLIIGGLFASLVFYLKNRPSILNTVLVSLTVLLIGYSSFAILVIRSKANTPMDENNPENAINLLSYLNREQYGDWPIMYGQYYNAPLDPQQPYKDGSPVYTKDLATGKYVVTDDRKASIPNYDKSMSTIFPRMYSSQGQHISGYKQWAEIKGTPVNTTNNRGEPEVLMKPTFWENLKFFFSYQVGHMYVRYFLWNFSGRQNDIQGHGGILKGNWITGIKAFDAMRLGNQDLLPSSMTSNRAMNKFFMLPFILGIIGVFYQFRKDQQGALIVTLLFFFTGMAIIVYLNQTPYQPRERDYAYAGSFYAFAFWIGIAVYALYDWLAEKVNPTAVASLATIIGLFCGPVLMAKDGWDDHDRSNRYTARDFAMNYLSSLAPNAIIFTNGDNDTFPLWYAQEVEGFRTDVRVVNLSLSNTDWYIEQMRRKAYDSEPIPLTLTESQYRQGTRDYVPIYQNPRLGLDTSKYYDIHELVKFIASEDADAKLSTQGGAELNYLPTGKIAIPVDSAALLANGTIPKDFKGAVQKQIFWEIKKSYLLKADLMIMDILATNNWKRPVYFAITVGDDSYLNLEDYFQLEGLAYRVVPIRTFNPDGQTGRVNADLMYDNVMNKFHWGGMEKDNIYMDENNLRMTFNFRNNFARLAEALMREGKKDKAVKVLDKCMEVMPKKTIPFNYFMLPVAEAFYRCEQPEKGNNLVKELANIYEQDLKYYFSLERSYYDKIDYEAQQAMSVMQRLTALTKGYKQDALAKDIEARFKALEQQFLTRQPTASN
jgi:hypothetical protein